MDVYALLPTESALNYDMLKECLLKRFDKTEDGFKQRFRSCRPESGETFQQFAVRLASFFDRWVDMSGITRNFNGIVDLMLRDQFLHICNRDVVLFLKERVPKDMLEMSRLADHYKEARRANVVSLTNPNFRGSPKKGKPNDVKGFQNKDNRTSNNRKCFTCGKVGHISINCTSQSRSGYNKPYQNKFSKGNNSTCASISISTPSIVYSKVHNPIPLAHAVMPVVKGMLGDGEVSVLRDTGCSGVVVRKSLVDSKHISDEYQDCVMADGSKVRVSVASVAIDTPYYSGTVKAWCMDKPVYDVIVGNIDGAREPNNPDPDYMINVVTRQQARQLSKPYPKLIVPKSIVDINVDDIKREQQSDATLIKIREKVSAGTVYEKADSGTVKFFEKKSLIFREFQSPKIEKGKIFRQLVVPEKYRRDVMRVAHESIMAGHLATKRTVSRVMTEFFWPGITSDVKRFCRSCNICQRTVPKGRHIRAPLGKMPIVDIPFRRVAVDIVGPLVPITDKGNRYVLTLVDYATRYPEAVALPSIETERVAEALIEVFCRVGFPREILTDRGAQFTSALMAEMSRLISLRQLTTTPYHPMCNGLVERFNGTLKLILKRLCAERPKDWDRYLGPALFAYREVPQESSRFSPFELVYGWSVRGPMTILKELWSKEISDPELRSTYEYVINLRDRLESTCELVRENLEHASRKQARVYNRRSGKRKLKPGQKVLILLPTKANKLLMHWKGPYNIVERVGDLDYRISVKGKLKLFHVNMLKLYVERDCGSVGVIGQLSDNTDIDIVDINTVGTCASVSVIDENLISEEDEGYGELVVPPTCNSSETYEHVHINPELEHGQVQQVRSLLWKYTDVMTDVPGHTNVLEHDIKLTSKDPVKQKPYPIPYAMVGEVEKEIDKMLKLNVIEESNSPYSSPFVIVKKKDKTNRFCIDFRALNRITVFDAEPMPNIEDTFAKISNFKFCSKIDLTKGYWQIPLTSSAKPLTAFQSPKGLFQFSVMPFGTINSGASFSRLMRKVLKNLQNVDNFVDDIIIYTDTFSHHLIVLENVLRRLAEANLTAKPSKCFIGYHQLDCLGHTIGQGRLLPGPDKVDAIREAPRPETKKQVRSFLGLANFYRKFVPDFATIASPLTDLTKKGLPNHVKWGSNEQQAFTKLKSALVSSPVLKLPNFDSSFLVQTDASDVGLGAVLLQDEDGVRLPVMYASRKLSKTERNYSVIEKECLGIVWALQKFEKYLYGREFVLETDHRPLMYLQRSKLANSRLMRWSLLIQPYRFRIEAIKGRDNVGADYLSRC